HYPGRRHWGLRGPGRTAGLVALLVLLVLHVPV
ncbi:MAG: hypothetical protein AVDCRST_MAG89-2057, partial [uncultured Gemmatimonadetes bacterium]